MPATVCPACEGTGSVVLGALPLACPTCSGQGIVAALEFVERERAA